MSWSISAACLARALVFEGAFEGLGRAGACVGAVDEGAAGCSRPFSSFSLLAVTLVVSWARFSARPSLDLPFSVVSFSFLLEDFWGESEDRDLE